MLSGAGKTTFVSGPAGPPNVLTVRNVATGTPGSQAAAQISGTAPNQVLDLTIPQGPMGGTGLTGPTGPLPWQTPVAWAAATAYTATAPASCVTYGGGCYVCTTAHTSGPGFDQTKWTQIAAPGQAPGALLASNNLSEVASVGQTVANLEQAPSAPSASATLATSDAERDLFATGTITLTMPSAAAGWQSGIITNDNLIAGIITLAVPSGASLDGAPNGTTTLYPFQRARIRQTSASTYRTVWIDRTPMVAKVPVSAATPSFDVNLPAGFSKFRFSISGVSMSTQGATLGMRFSDGGAAAVKSGSSDYFTNRLYGYNSTYGDTSNNDSYGYISYSINDNGGVIRTMAFGEIYPGAAGQQPLMIFKSCRRNADPNFVTEECSILYQGTTSGAMGRVNLLRFLASTGNINPGATLTVWGEE